MSFFLYIQLSKLGILYPVIFFFFSSDPTAMIKNAAFMLKNDIIISSVILKDVYETNFWINKELFKNVFKYLKILYIVDSFFKAKFSFSFLFF